MENNKRQADSLFSKATREAISHAAWEFEDTGELYSEFADRIIRIVASQLGIPQPNHNETEGEQHALRNQA